MAVADPIQIRAVGGVQTFDTGSRYCLEREKISSLIPGFPTIDPLDLLGRTVLFSHNGSSYFARVNSVEFCSHEGGSVAECSFAIQRHGECGKTVSASYLKVLDVIGW